MALEITFLEDIEQGIYALAMSSGSVLLTIFIVSLFYPLELGVGVLVGSILLLLVGFTLNHFRFGVRTKSFGKRVSKLEELVSELRFGVNAALDSIRDVLTKENFGELTEEILSV